MLQKYYNKYKKIPIQARASFWFLVCGILQNGLSVITLPIFTRILTTEQYGLSSTYFSWNDLIVVICTLRLSYGVFDKGLLRYGKDRDRFESALLGLTTTISLFMLGLFLIFHKQVEAVMGMSFILCFSLFACQIFAPSLLFWTARNKFEYRYQKFATVTVATVIVSTLLNLSAVLLLPFDRGSVKILSYQLVWCVVYAAFYVYIFAKGKTFYWKDVWKYALKFNIPLIPYFLSTLILDKADRIMIRSFCGDTPVALYSVSYNVARLMVLLTSALDATFTPWIYQKMKADNFSNSKKIASSILMAFIVLATMFMLFAPELITIFAAEQYKEAVYIIPPVIASYFFVMMYNLISKIEFYYEKIKGVAFVTVMAALLDVVLNFIAIPKFGYVAAGYTTLISYVFMAAGHYIMSGKIAKEKGIYMEVFPWKLFTVQGLIMLVITVCVNVFYKYTYLRLGILFVLAVSGVLCHRKIMDLIRTMKK